MIDRDLRAIPACVDSRQLPQSFADREFDRPFLADLRPVVDPCGERSEFHACLEFETPIRVEVGAVVGRDRFWFADLILGERGSQ
jgi:diphthamide synthase (EF-2-diphthine--ammonia ligase)